MHKRMHPILFILPLLLGACDANTSFLQRDYYGCSTWFTISSYDSKLDFTNSVDEIISHYSKLFDGFKEYKNMNNIYTINHTNEEVILKQDLYTALKESFSYIETTNGYFNPFIGKLTYMYKEFYENNQFPSENEINNALLQSFNSKLHFNDEKLSVQREGEGLIDLGGFAKGFIIDRVQDYMVENEVKSYLLNGGLSSLFATYKPGDAPFKIALDYFPNRLIEVKDKAISASGTYRADQYVEIEGKRYSHIISPKTGRPDAKSDCVYLIGNQKSSLMDALSTAFILLEDENEIKEMAKKFDLEYIVAKDNKLVIKSETLEVKTY